MCVMAVDQDRFVAEKLVNKKNSGKSCQQLAYPSNPA
jgi:hypothetical protein